MTPPPHCVACALLAVPREIRLVEFRILGALNLLGADGHELKSILAQPKRVALLAYLAAVTPQRLPRRDSLTALFWPELDQEHARAALRQALHGLRQELGEGVLVSRGYEEVGLDVERLRCDVVEFERATQEGRLADAHELYRGELLEGFFIRRAIGFEQWLEDERARLRSVALRSATSLADQRQADGDLAESARWTRRALRIAPFDEPTLRRGARRLCRFHTAAQGGARDRSGARDSRARERYPRAEDRPSRRAGAKRQGAAAGDAARALSPTPIRPRGCGLSPVRLVNGTTSTRFALSDGVERRVTPKHPRSARQSCRRLDHARSRINGAARACGPRCNRVGRQSDGCDRRRCLRRGSTGARHRLRDAGVGFAVPPRGSDRAQRQDHRRAERQRAAPARAGARRSTRAARGTEGPA